MRVLTLLWSLGLAAASLSAQNPGVTPEWETRKFLEKLSSTAQKLDPLVAEIDPAAWIEKGAPDTYKAQWQTVRNAIANVKIATNKLVQEPTSIALSLEALFRLDGLNTYLGSFASGVRRYQNPAIADLLLGVADENSSNREHLKQYILELAAARESEFKVMESEAQRCLSVIVKQPPATPAPRPKDRK
ncbi:MAG TPA: hypothetical protein VFQ91_25080 [Bryobacteraceae bacterium]|nr:hypothetical protein [Bryobacteraceae bacterium]